MNIRELALTSAFFVAVAGVAGAQEGDRYAFSELDADGDGSVTLEELQTGLSSGDLDDPEGMAATVMENQDTNGDGMLSAEEAGADMAVYADESEDLEEQ